jgi:inorganic pyrophosphatase
MVPRWHASAYLCTLLGCYGDVPHTSVNDGDPHDVDMESKGNGTLDIYDDAPVIAKGLVVQVGR